MDLETLHLKIGLTGTSTKKQPEFNISVNSKIVFSGCLTKPPGELEFFEFDVQCVEGNNSLEITLLNKESADTVQENGKIVEDLMLCINHLEIDDIDLHTLLWTNSSYYPIYPDNYLDENQKSIKQVKNTKDLGWNGTWVFPFVSPFYIWLLENL